jgi:hypothetical protein
LLKGQEGVSMLAYNRVVDAYLGLFRDHHESLEPMGIHELNRGSTHEYVDPRLLMMPFPRINAGLGIALHVHS